MVRTSLFCLLVLLGFISHSFAAHLVVSVVGAGGSGENDTGADNSLFDSVAPADIGKDFFASDDVVPEQEKKPSVQVQKHQMDNTIQQYFKNRQAAHQEQYKKSKTSDDQDLDQAHEGETK